MEKEREKEEYGNISRERKRHSEHERHRAGVLIAFM